MNSDSEETFVKQVYSPPNFHELKPIDHDSSDFQCGQTNFQVNDDCSQQEGDGELYDMDDNSQCDTASFQVSNVVFDQLDQDLSDLPRDNYIAKLLQSTQSCEDTISRYRIELARKAKRCRNSPSGTLITRRCTSKSSVSEKYATDCFTLWDFINGNRSDVNELFKPPMTPKPRVPSIANTDAGKNSPINVEIQVLKDTVSQLLADVSELKTEMHQAKDSVSTFSNSMKKELTLLKNELDECKYELNKNLNSELQSVVKQSDKLSVKLGYMMKSINKLEKSRSSFANTFDDHLIKIRDNATGIEHLNDVNTGGNLGMKHQIKELQEKVDEFQEQNNKLSEDNHTTESQVVEVRKKVNLMERKLGDAPVNRLEQAFKSLSSDISAKIDKMCSILTDANEKRNTVSGSLVYEVDKKQYRRSVTPRPGVITLDLTNDQDEVNAGDSYNNPVIDIAPQREQEIASNYANATRGATRSDPPPRTIETPEYSAIPVIGREVKSVSRFKGVVRKQSKKYFISGIDMNSDEASIRDFLEENDVVCSKITLSENRNRDALSGQLIIWEEHAERVEAEYFWPNGVVLRPWRPKPRPRRQKAARDNHEPPGSTSEPNVD